VSNTSDTVAAPPVPEPRPAATVVLVRDTGDGPEVFVLTRVATMAFAAGATVFPGGSVDASDADRPTGLAADAGPDGVPDADRLVTAAVRELFEEAGVLLATGTLPAPQVLDRARDDLAAHRTSLAAFLAAHDLSLDTGLLRPWARWITPPGQTRRYDTMFFLAVLPEGQEAKQWTTEALSGVWARPQALLDDALAGRLMLMTPTQFSLTELAAAGSVAELMTAERDLEAVRPQVISAPGEPLRLRIRDVVVDSVDDRAGKRPAVAKEQD
jgi:8-oxo-dGTP pyrophosphatase MutT (NUDIX family)